MVPWRMFHPLCGYSLGNWLKILVAFDIIMTSMALNLTLLGIALIIGVDYKWIPSAEMTHNFQLHLKTVITIAVFLVLDLLLDIWLWILIPTRDGQKCKAWFLLKFTFEICDAIGFIVEVACGFHTMVYIIPMMFDFVFNAYLLWVVFTYIWEIKGSVPGVNNNAFVKFFKSDEESSIKQDDIE